MTIQGQGIGTKKPKSLEPDSKNNGPGQPPGPYLLVEILPAVSSHLAMMDALTTAAPEGLSVAARLRILKIREDHVCLAAQFALLGAMAERLAPIQRFAEANLLHSAIHPREPPEPVNFPCSRPACAGHLRMHWEHFARVPCELQSQSESALCRNCGGQVFLVDEEGKQASNFARRIRADERIFFPRLRILRVRGTVPPQCARNALPAPSDIPFHPAHGELLRRPQPTSSTRAPAVTPN